MMIYDWLQQARIFTKFTKHESPLNYLFLNKILTHRNGIIVNPYILNK